MVFTVSVRIGGGGRRYGLSRRAVLSALGGSTVVLLAGCDPLHTGAAPDRSPDPLEPLLAGTLALLGRYDAAIAATPELAARLTPIRDNHRAHAAALAGLTGTSPTRVPPSAATPSTPATPVLPDLRAAERTGYADAIDACLAASADRAGLLGSIAACRATHLGALR